MNYRTLVNEIIDMYERGKFYAEMDFNEKSDKHFYQSGHEEGSYQHMAFSDGYSYKMLCLKHKEQMDRLIIKA